MKRLIILLVLFLVGCGELSSEYTPNSLPDTNWQKETPYGNAYLAFYERTLAIGYGPNSNVYFMLYTYDRSTRQLWVVTDQCVDADGRPIEGRYVLQVGSNTLDMQVLEDECTPRRETFIGRWTT